MSDHNKPKRKRRKKPEGTSARQRAANRVNALKTAEHATLPENQDLGFCKPHSHFCPHPAGKCSERIAADAAGQVMARCHLKLQMAEEFAQGVLQAMQGDTTSYDHANAQILGRLQAVAYSVSLRLAHQGDLSEEIEIAAPDGAIFKRRRVDPSVDPLLKITTMLGANADQSRISRQAMGDAKKTADTVDPLAAMFDIHDASGE